MGEGGMSRVRGQGRKKNRGLFRKGNGPALLKRMKKKRPLSCFPAKKAKALEKSAVSTFSPRTHPKHKHKGNGRQVAMMSWYPTVGWNGCKKSMCTTGGEGTSKLFVKEPEGRKERNSHGERRERGEAIQRLSAKGTESVIRCLQRILRTWSRKLRRKEYKKKTTRASFGGSKARRIKPSPT